jgi:micrococcal nuclease
MTPRGLLLLFACVLSEAHAEEPCKLPPCDGSFAMTFSARTIAVIDGDTVLVLRNGNPVKIRLADIDAPEKGQDFGMASRNSLTEMVLGKQIRVSTLARDKYGRLVAHLSVGGLDVSEEQVRRGMAWQYSHHFRSPHYIALQDEARNAGRGLWKQAHPVKPWQWRKRHPLEIPAKHAKK